MLLLTPAADVCLCASTFVTSGRWKPTECRGLMVLPEQLRGDAGGDGGGWKTPGGDGGLKHSRRWWHHDDGWVPLNYRLASWSSQVAAASRRKKQTSKKHSLLSSVNKWTMCACPRGSESADQCSGWWLEERSVTKLGGLMSFSWSLVIGLTMDGGMTVCDQREQLWPMIGHMTRAHSLTVNWPVRRTQRDRFPPSMFIPTKSI